MVVFVVLSLGAVISALAPEPEFRVGRILVVGNTDTPDRVILNRLVGLAPGRKASPATLRRAEGRLRAIGVFKSNPWRGTGPTVEVFPNELDNEYFDVLIRVVERPGNWVPFSLAEVIRAYLQFDNYLFVMESMQMVGRAVRGIGCRR